MIFLPFHYTILLKKFCRHHICEIQHQKNFTVFLSWPLLLFHFNERIQWLLLKTSLSCRGGGCLKSDPLWVSSYTRHTPGRQPTVWAGEVIMTLGWRAVSSDRVLETTSVTCISSWEGPVWKTRYFLAFVQSSRVTCHDTWYPNKATLWKEVQPSFGEKAQKTKKNPQIIISGLIWLALLLTCCLTLNKPHYCSGFLFPSQLSHEEWWCIICKATHQLTSCLLDSWR